MATNNAVNVSLSGQSGTGSFAGTTSPSFTTPVLGTPTSGTLTNCTGLPVSTGISGLGTGVATWLASPTSANLASAVATTSTGSGSLVFATSPSLVTPILGTPTSGTLTNCTGLPVSTGISGLGTGVATWLATPTSANLLSAVATTNTGTGALVFATSPALVTPALGTPASGVLTNCTGLPVGGGGTGASSFTAYSVICAGTTSGGAFQNVSGVGSTGQVLTSNGASALPTWQSAGASTGRLLSFQIFTSGSAATYTKAGGATAILVECVGGGGGGGGVTGGSGSNYAAAGGGGGGGYCRKWITSASSTYTYTVGAGGNGGAAGNNPGTTGTATTFSTLSATGGTGGSGLATQSSSTAGGALGGLGGVPTGGDINVQGQTGGWGIIAAGNFMTGLGGGSFYGGGAQAAQTLVGTVGSAGVNANANTGGGGSGAGNSGVNTNRAGGNGGSGIIVVWEFS